MHPEKRVAGQKTASRIFFAAPLKTHPENATQTLGTHQENYGWSYDFASECADAPNSELRETSGVGGSVTLPTPTADQIKGVTQVWSRYVGFEGSASDREQIQTLFAQSVLFRRPTGQPSMAIREVIRVLVDQGAGSRITIGFGAGNETTRDYSGATNSFISIENFNSGGKPISSEQMVVSIMHEMLHATDRIRGMSYLEAVERHNEIYRIQNQTLYDLGLPLDPGPGGSRIPNPDKYTGPKW